MINEDYNPSHRARIIFYYGISVFVVILLMVLFSSWRTKPLEETITIDSARTKTNSMAAQPLPTELPPPDRDIETAGDRVAAAMIYLNRKQNEPALTAVDQATAATQRALDRNSEKSSIRDQLQTTNQQLAIVKDLIKSGRIGTATTALKEVDQKLEAVSY